MTAFIDLAKRWKDVLILAGFFLTIGGFIVRPFAEDFVRTTVNERIITLEEQLAAVQAKLAEQSSSQNRTESDLASLKALNTQLLDILKKMALRQDAQP